MRLIENCWMGGWMDESCQWLRPHAKTVFSQRRIRNKVLLDSLFLLNDYALLCCLCFVLFGFSHHEVLLQFSVVHICVVFISFLNDRELRKRSVRSLPTNSFPCTSFMVRVSSTLLCSISSGLQFSKVVIMLPFFAGCGHVWK